MVELPTAALGMVDDVVLAGSKLVGAPQSSSYVSDKPSFWDTVDSYLALPETIVNVAGFAPVLPMALAPVGWAVGKVGFKGTQNTLGKPHEWMEKPVYKDGVMKRSTALMDIPMALTSAFGMYHEGRSFGKEMYALGDVERNVTGKERSWWDLLTSDKVSQTTKNWRQEAYKEAAQFGMQAGMMGWLVNGLRKGTGAITGTKSMLAFMGLQMVSSAGMGLLFGSSGTDLYKQMNAAIKQHQDLAPDVYAQFIKVSSKEIEKRGHVGELVAHKIGEEYAKEKATPDQILKEVEGGKFMARVQKVIGAAEAEHNAQMKAAQEKRAHAMQAQQAKQHQPNKNWVAAQQKNQPQPRPQHAVVGDGVFTGRLNQEASNQLAPRTV